MFYPVFQGQKGEHGEKGENGDQVNVPVFLRNHQKHRAEEWDKHNLAAVDAIYRSLPIRFLLWWSLSGPNRVILLFVTLFS